LSDCTSYQTEIDGLVPNKADAQNPAMTSLFQSGRYWRRVRDLRRSPEPIIRDLSKSMLMKTIISVISILVGLSASLPGARAAAFGDLGPYFSFTYGDGGGIPADVLNVTSQETSLDGQSVKLFGDLGPIDGARFAGGFVLYWSGGFQGPINPGDKLVADLNFDVNATGGTLDWSFYANLWSNEGFEQAQVLTSLMPVPASGQVSGVHFESSPFTQPGDTDLFQGYLHIDWTGFNPTDTFSISIPQNSIDITYIPEPNSCSLALIALALSLGNLRRRGRFGLAAIRRTSPIGSRQRRVTP
jgi:hypothetical protein